MTFVDLIGQKAQNILFLVSKSKSSLLEEVDLGTYSLNHYRNEPMAQTRCFKNLNSLKGGWYEASASQVLNI